jgi:hypothetical protein
MNEAARCENTWGSGVIAPLILTSALGGGRKSSSRPSLYPQGKSPRYPLGRKMSGPKSGLQVVTMRKIVSMQGIEPRLSRPLSPCIIFFFLWLYSPILGLGRLHQTFRFISVTRSRTVGWTPWTSDQLVARPLLTAPGDCDDGEVGGMNGFSKETEVLGENLPRRHFVHHKCYLPDPGANPGRRGGKPATNRFSYGAAASYDNRVILLANYTNLMKQSFVLIW